MAQPDYGYNPSAGYTAPPGNGVDPNYSPYGNIYNKNAQRPQHHAYDPRDGRPIPPGFEPSPGASAQQSYPPDQYGADPYGRPPPGRSEYDRGYYEGPPTDYGYPGSPRGYGDRPYAPDEPYPHDGNAITPFDEEKYEAEVRDEQARRYAAQAPPGDYFDRGGTRRGVYGDDRRYDPRYEDRYSQGDSYYDCRDRDPRDRRYSDERDEDRRYDDRRRDSRQKEEPRSPTKKSKDIFDGREAQVLGGSMGGLLGSQFGGGVLETLGGVVVGAVGAKVLEKQKLKRDGKKLSGADPKIDAPSQRGEGGARRVAPRDEPRYDPRDDRRDPRDDRRGAPRDYASTAPPPRSRSRGRRDEPYYSDEYSPSPPPGPGRR